MGWAPGRKLGHIPGGLKGGCQWLGEGIHIGGGEGGIGRSWQGGRGSRRSHRGLQLDRGECGGGMMGWIQGGH